MTLVAAEIAEGQIRVAADSLSTDPYGAPRRFLDSTLLKIVLLHPALCVAYGGSSEEALHAIRGLGINPHTGFNLNQVCDALLAAHKRSGAVADFLVAGLSPVPSLTRISGGQLLDCQHQALIGSHAAMAAYRDVYDPGGGGDGVPGERMINRIEAAIEAVIEDDTVDGVGGYCIRVANKEHGFIYLNQGTIADGRLELPGGSPAGTYVVPLAGTPEGGHRYVLMTPQQAGLGAIGLYFQPGNLGLIFYPARRTDPFKFSDVTQEEFIENAWRATGVALQRYGRLDPI